VDRHPHGAGFRQIHSRQPKVCEPGSYCAQPNSARITKTLIWASFALVLAALTINWWDQILY